MWQLRRTPLWIKLFPVILLSVSSVNAFISEWSIREPCDQTKQANHMFCDDFIIKEEEPTFFLRLTTKLNDVFNIWMVAIATISIYSMYLRSLDNKESIEFLEHSDLHHHGDHHHDDNTYQWWSRRCKSCTRLTRQNTNLNNNSEKNRWNKKVRFAKGTKLV